MRILEGRSLFGDVERCDRFFGDVGVRSLFGCEGDRFWGNVGMGDRFDNEGFGGAIAFWGVSERSLFLCGDSV
jgi:hypothetical protein